MNLQEFVDKWNGKHCEMGGSANAINQCVDLANAYITEVLQLPGIFWTNAQDFPSKAGDKYDYILNTPTGVPEPGDIVIWKSKDNVGHIAIFIKGTSANFYSFDQNWPTGSTCHTQYHTYKTSIGTDVIGWLRAKKIVVSDNPLQKDLDEAHRNIDNLQTQVNGLVGEKRQLTLRITSLSSDLGTVRGENQALSQKVESQNTIIGEYQKEDAVQISQLTTAQNERKFYKDLNDMILWDIEDELKLSHPSEDFDTRWSKVIQAVQSLKEAKQIQLDTTDYSLLFVLGGKTIVEIKR